MAIVTETTRRDKIQREAIIMRTKLAAGLRPVQVVFDNQGTHPLRINPGQTFLEDAQGNLWPILNEQTAYERATRYADTKQIFKEGAYGGFLGAAAGAIIGAAIGIVAGGNVGAEGGG